MGELTVWEYGSMGVWECGSVGVWECQCADVQTKNGQQFCHLPCVHYDLSSVFIHCPLQSNFHFVNEVKPTLCVLRLKYIAPIEVPDFNS
jgi:hypothetical protein